MFAKHPHDPPPEHRRRWPVAAGSLLGVGFAPALRGTAGTLAAGLPALGLIALAQGSALTALWLGLAVAFSVLSLLAARAWLRQSGALKDPGWFVLDEAAGFYLTLALISGGTVLDICFAFLSFRAYDMAKPWPIKLTERLPGSVGILADDLAAAVLAAFSVRALWVVLDAVR